MPLGTIILLNGTSSAGKTYLSASLQRVLPEPYLYFGADILGAMCPRAYNAGEHGVEGVSFVPVEGAAEPTTAMVCGAYGHFLVEGLHRATATLVRMGHNIVMDHCLHEPYWLEDCLATLRDLPVLFVGVRCPLDVTEQRERNRGNRAIGLARWQFERVHARCRYDLEVDTSLQRPTACARTIAAFLAEGRPFKAFQQLAASA